VKKRERKRPLARYRRGRKNNIIMDLTDTGWEDVDWINMDHDWVKWRAVVNTVMDPHAP